ncbi:hypothetical protein Plhal703r1_c61g0165561 [Plasmopara halstedii]
MTYSPEPFLANIERIYAAQKCYYRRTCDARLSYQRATTIKIETKLDGKAETKTKFIDDKAEPNIEVNVFFSIYEVIPDAIMLLWSHKT